mmetsp:Transcript_56851/g.144166  ORF Transcript_56851/g.144166 Transcript_56851/m.144166 type:complete len:330 (-) Transcript_56851:236-1225(-)
MTKDELIEKLVEHVYGPWLGVGMRFEDLEDVGTSSSVPAPARGHSTFMAFTERTLPGTGPKFRPVPPPPLAHLRIGQDHLRIGGKAAQRSVFKLSMGSKPSISIGVAQSLRPNNDVARPGLLPKRTLLGKAAGAGVAGDLPPEAAPKATATATATATASAPKSGSAAKNVSFPSMPKAGFFHGHAGTPVTGPSFAAGAAAAKGVFRASATPLGRGPGNFGMQGPFKPGPRSGPTPPFFPKGVSASGGFFGFGPGGPSGPKLSGGRAMPPTLEKHYRELGVQPGTGLEEVRHSYRKLVLQYHPDKNTAPDALEKFRKVQEAYEAVCRQLR